MLPLTIIVYFVADNTKYVDTLAILTLKYDDITMIAYPSLPTLAQHVLSP